MKASKDRGIVRIDQPEKYNHGWWVRRRRGSKMYSKFFADKKHGGKNKARLAAREFNEGLTESLPPVSRRRASNRNARLTAAGSSARGGNNSRGSTRNRPSAKTKAAPTAVRRSAAAQKTNRLFQKAQRLPQSRRQFAVGK